MHGVQRTSIIKMAVFCVKTAIFQHESLAISGNTINWNLSFRTENCPVPFRAAAGADRTTDRTVTHWLRALPAKFQFIGQNQRLSLSVPGGAALIILLTIL